MTVTPDITLRMTDEDRRALLQVTRDFVQAEIAPHVAEYDAAEKLPQELLDKTAEAGLYGGTIPVEYGGLGLDHVTFAALIEEVSKVCHVLGTLVSMPSGLVGGSVLRYGTEEQKQRWL